MLKRMRPKEIKPPLAPCHTEDDASIVPEQHSDFLARTISVWQRYSDRPLTEEDARQIIENMTGFFRTLADWENTELSRRRRRGVTDKG
jgi:hypothetical protein